MEMRLQFTIRGLLLAMAAVGVGCWWTLYGWPAAAKVDPMLAAAGLFAFVIGLGLVLIFGEGT